MRPWLRPDSFSMVELASGATCDGTPSCPRGQGCSGGLCRHRRTSVRAEARASAAEAQRLAALLVPGNAISAVRQVTERLSSRRWQRITERVTFTLARQTRLYYIAADGRRFAKYTFRQFTASSEWVAHG